MILAVPFPLFADAGGIVAIVVALLTIMGWLLNQLSAKGPHGQPPAQRPGRPARPRNDRLQEELDAFIQNIGGARGRPKPGPQSAPSESNPPRRNRVEKAPSAVASQSSPAATRRRTPGEEMAKRRAPVDDSLGRGVRAHVSEHMSERTLKSKVDEDLKDRVSDSVASHLGTFTATAPHSSAAPAGAAQRVRRLFLEPSNVKRAILINAVLSRPKSLEK